MPLSIRVDRTANAREDVGPSLRLVENDPFVGGDTRLPLKIQTKPLRFLLQIEVGTTNSARQRRLAALPRAEDRHGRISTQTTAQLRKNLAGNHSCRLTLSFYSARTSG